MTDAASVNARIKKIVVDQLGVEETEIKESSNFINDLGADSLDIVELVMAMEEEFDIEIPDEQAEHIVSFGQAVEYVEKVYSKNKSKK